MEAAGIATGSTVRVGSTNRRADDELIAELRRASLGKTSRPCQHSTLKPWTSELLQSALRRCASQDEGCRFRSAARPTAQGHQERQLAMAGALDLGIDLVAPPMAFSVGGVRSKCGSSDPLG